MEPDSEQGDYCRRRGRPRLNRTLKEGPDARCYAPQCNSGDESETVLLLPEEMAALSLIDFQDLEQEAAAAELGVSRKTIWRDIHEARHKIADALIHGKTIRIERCARRLSGHCPQQNQNLCPKTGGICPRNAGAQEPDTPV